MNKEICQELTDEELILLYKEINNFIEYIDKELEKVSEQNDR